MPLKYVFDIPEPTEYIGMAHGLLFIVYCMWVILCATQYKWTTKSTLQALVAAILPFGTFVADKKIFIPQQAKAV